MEEGATDRKRKSIVETVRDKWREFTSNASSLGKRGKTDVDDADFIALEPQEGEEGEVEEGEEGQVVIHAVGGLVVSELDSPPWVNEADHKVVVGGRRSNGGGTLEQELKYFVEWVKPTARERSLREKTVARCRYLVSQTWSSRDAVCHVFGSVKLDLYLPGSDVDFVILGYGVQQQQPRPLRKLANTIRNKQYASEMTLIEKSRVPIIKYTDAETRLQCDVSFDMENGVLISDCFARILDNKYMSLVRPLAFCIKYWLRSHELHEPFSGGLGSFSVLVLLISMMQQHNRKGELGTLEAGLRFFFHFYGTQFNWITTGISIHNGGNYFRKEDRGGDFYDPSEPWRPALEDPLDESNNVARATFALPRIRDAMVLCDEMLRDPVEGSSMGIFFEICARHVGSPRLK